MTHYREKEDSSVYFECRTGLQGVAKENVKLNLTFTRNDSRKCSAICGEEQQLECNGGKLSWSEDVGLCRLTIARPVTADSGELCCTASNSRNSEVKDCDTLSVLEGVKILPATTQSTHSHELSELAKIIVGSTCGGVLLIIVVVVAVIVALIIVWAWWRRRRPEPAPLVRYQSMSASFIIVCNNNIPCIFSHKLHCNFKCRSWRGRGREGTLIRILSCTMCMIIFSAISFLGNL